MDQVVAELTERRRAGARALVLLLKRCLHSCPRPEPTPHGRAMTGAEVASLMAALGRAWQSGRLEPGAFTLVGLTEFGADVRLVQGNELLGLGAVTLDYDVQPLEPLLAHVSRLNVTNNDRNPWWRQFLAEKTPAGLQAQLLQLFPF